MSTSGSVTRWIAKVKEGDQEAAQKLWEHYFRRLAALARAKLPAAQRRVADEEDVALGALDSFFRRARKGKYKELHDHHDLWRLLAKITYFKTCDHIRRIPKESGESALVRGSEPDQELQGIDAWKDDNCAFPFDPGTMIVLSEKEAMDDHFRRLTLGTRELLEKLNDDKLRLVALRILQGYKKTEIADELGCVPSTVDLKIKRIQKLWGREIT